MTPESKFDLIKHWSLPPHAIFLLSFIVLCGFYNWYYPWFETNIKPLCKLQCIFHIKHIYISWTPTLIALFNDCKQRIVASTFLLRYDSSKPEFVMTDLLTCGMRYIFIQANDSFQSLAALKSLEDTGECTFDSDFWRKLSLFCWWGSL